MSGDRTTVINSHGRDLSVMSGGAATVVPDVIRVVVSPDWRGVVETNVPGAQPVVMGHGPRWVRALRGWWSKGT